MAEDASPARGAPQVAGTLVNPKGLTKIVFGTGVTWEFDIPRQANKSAQGRVTALGAQLT